MIAFGYPKMKNYFKNTGTQPAFLAYFCLLQSCLQTSKTSEQTPANNKNTAHYRASSHLIVLTLSCSSLTPRLPEDCVVCRWFPWKQKPGCSEHAEQCNVLELPSFQILSQLSSLFKEWTRWMYLTPHIVPYPNWEGRHFRETEVW